MFPVEKICWTRLLPCEPGSISVVSFSIIICIDNSFLNCELGLECLHTSIFIEIPSMKRLSNKAKVVPSIYTIRPIQLDTNPVILGLGGGFELPPHQYIYQGTISRRATKQGCRFSISPQDKTVSIKYQTSYFLVLVVFINIIIFIIVLFLFKVGT